MSGGANIGAVIIGRNEGARLVACLASVKGAVAQVVYVDSGSTDGSLEAAREAGAHVVELDLSQPFTAARARNTGLAAFLDIKPVELVQFIDGDCLLNAGWIPAAKEFLAAHPDAAVVCGRRRERFPEASIYNQLCDREWDTPIGEALACGGDALMRVAALQQVGGYNPALIAGEEPEMCVRLRAAGQKIWRLDHEMTLHDAAMMRLGQWWKRSKRAGYAYAEGAALHGAPPERHGVAQTRRALIGGLVLPVGILLLTGLVSGWFLLLAAIYPAQILRLALRDGTWVQAFFLTLGKFPEASGVFDYYMHRLIGRKQTLIEYK